MAKPSPFPVVPGKSWYSLREKAKISPNTKLNSANVASILGLPEASAQTNVLRGLRALGVIDDQGILSPAGEKWRVDSSYEDACAEILEASLSGGSAASDREVGGGWPRRGSGLVCPEGFW